MMKRYECEDLFAVLGSLVEQHVRSYKTDFDTDKEILEKALEGEEKDFLWFLRDTGTCCVEERAAYIDGTYGHAECSTFLYDSVKAYVVHVDGKEDGKVSGKVYPMDPKGLYEEIMKNTVAAHGVKLTLGDEMEMVVPYETYNGRASFYHREYDVVKKEYLLTEEDERKVSALLRERQDARGKAKEGDTQEFMQKKTKLPLDQRIDVAKGAQVNGVLKKNKSDLMKRIDMAKGVQGKDLEQYR